MTVEQFQELLDAVMGQRRVSDLRRLRAKDIRAEKFNGEEIGWEEWAFSFKRSIRSQSAEAYKKMVEVEGLSDELVEDAELEEKLEGMSGELYDILCQVCAGEALAIIRGVDDCAGFAAWQKLHRKYNPKTMARSVRLMVEVTGPPRIADMHTLETELKKWENKVKKLKVEYGEELSNNMKMALFTNMMPTYLQDLIYTHLQKDMTYEELRDKVRAWAANKVASSNGRVPMDVGMVRSEEEEEEVGAISGNVRCHNCGGMGHFARECPSRKGKGGGKGGKGGTEAAGGKGGNGGYPSVAKGSPKGSKGEKGSKGAGKSGYQGTCWRCFKVGHKANECTARVNGVDEETAEEAEKEEVECGGVWVIGQVEVQKSKVVAGGGKNRYEALREEEKEEEEAKEEEDDHEHETLDDDIADEKKNEEAKKVEKRQKKKSVASRGEEKAEEAKEGLREVRDETEAEQLPIPWVTVQRVGGKGSRAMGFEARGQRSPREGAQCPCFVPGGCGRSGWRKEASKEADEAKRREGWRKDPEASKEERRAEETKGLRRFPRRSEAEEEDTRSRRQKEGKPVEKVKSQVRLESQAPKSEETVIGAVTADSKAAREKSLVFNVADVRKPLASAVKVCEAGNRIVLDPDPSKCRIENVQTGERISLRKSRGTYVFDVELSHDGSYCEITLDSGAGVSVWPQSNRKGLDMQPKMKGLQMVAANGTPIQYAGQAVVKFKAAASAEAEVGTVETKGGSSGSQGFRRQV